MNEQLLLGNCVEQDGIELAFRGDRCGRSYWIKRDNSLNRWVCYYNDWHEQGWFRINGWPGEKYRHEALEFCNQHALEKGLINFMPTRSKVHWTVHLSGAIAGAAIAGI